MNDLAQLAETTRPLIDAIKNSKSLGDAITNELTQWKIQGESLFTGISNVHEKIQGWDEDIQERDTKIRTLSQQIETLSKNSSELKEKLVSFVAKAEESSKFLKEYEANNKLLLEEIKETLGDSNRVGMAASFRERKIELGKAQELWQAIFIGSIIAILSVSMFLLSNYAAFTHISPNPFAWENILVKITILSPLIWLAWFAVRQYSFTNRVREDYSFKYAASMAYEGHKKATREVNPELEQVLLEFSLYNMALNPIRLYGKKEEDHSTPLSEVADKLLSRLPNLNKVSYETPTLGKITGYLGKKNKKNVTEEDADNANDI